MEETEDVIIVPLGAIIPRKIVVQLRIIPSQAIYIASQARIMASRPRIMASHALYAAAGRN